MYNKAWYETHREQINEKRRIRHAEDSEQVNEKRRQDLGLCQIFRIFSKNIRLDFEEKYSKNIRPRKKNY